MFTKEKTPYFQFELLSFNVDRAIVTQATESLDFVMGLEHEFGHIVYTGEKFTVWLKLLRHQQRYGNIDRARTAAQLSAFRPGPTLYTPAAITDRHKLERLEKQGEHPNFIPSAPDKTYHAQGWQNWNNWLGFDLLPFTKAHT